MIKIIAPLALFLLIVYLISSYWAKANTVGKKKIAGVITVLIFTSLATTLFLVIN